MKKEPCFVCGHTEKCIDPNCKNCGYCHNPINEDWFKEEYKIRQMNDPKNILKEIHNALGF